ncbi:hypothetical protein HMPREF9104_02531, partial [Lentilactobacillus kisonensis F0435]
CKLLLCGAVLISERSQSLPDAALFSNLPNKSVTVGIHVPLPKL